MASDSNGGYFQFLTEARLQDQTRAGLFPLRLKPEHWTSGANHWLLDVIAPNPHSAAAVISNFRQLVPDGRMKLHPGILRLLDAETLKSWGGGEGGQATRPVDGEAHTPAARASGVRR